MELKKIQEVADGWRNATWKVIEFQNPGFDVVRKLFEETYTIIEKYSNEPLIPKELSGLVIEMHDFRWWISDLEDTPLHSFYQGITHLVVSLNQYLLTNVVDVQDLKNTIEEIGG